MGVTNLSGLLIDMDPQLEHNKYYFGVIDQSALFVLAQYMQYITGVFQEDEGITIIFVEALKSIVEQRTKKPLVGPFAKITLNVNSDLLAVGFLAKITKELAKEEISVNAVSAYYHDHLFVEESKREKVMGILTKISRDSKK